jgi:uncharacterized protein DUF87
MDTETLARKLKPLMPKEVEHWLRVRNTAEPDLRGLIDRQIETKAREKLGDYENKALLSLPHKSRIKGPIHVGTVLYEKEKWPFGLFPEEILQGVGVFGRSGSGKTNLLIYLLEQLHERGTAWVLFDWKRTGRQALGRFRGHVKVVTPGRPVAPMRFNPFVTPPGFESNLYITHVIDVMAQAYTLGDGARTILHRALAALYEAENRSPTVQQVIDQVELTPNTGRAGGWKVSAMRALESLRFTDLGAQEGVTQEEQLRGLLTGGTIIELNGLAGNAKRFLINTICLWIYQLKLSTPVREKLDLVLVIDEAHHSLVRRSSGGSGGGEPLLESLLRMFRELGVGVIVADQHVHLTAAAAVGNAAVTFLLDQKEPADVRLAASIASLDASERRYLSMLEVGSAVVRLQGSRWNKPFLIKTPLVQFEKGRVSDAVLRGYLRGRRPHRGQTPGSGPNGRHEGSGGGFRWVPGEDKDVLGGEALIYIDDVIRYPDDGVRQRNRRLGFGGSKGQRIKQTLIERGWLDTQPVRVGNTRKVLLRPTSAAGEALALDAGTVPRPSLAHEYWKRYYAQRLKDSGYDVEVEAPRRGGRVDVLAKRADRAIGIEVETGKSDVVDNVRRCLASGFHQVWVVATDDGALRTVQRELAKANLLIPRRVELILGDEKIRRLVRGGTYG